MNTCNFWACDKFGFIFEVHILGIYNVVVGKYFKLQEIFMINGDRCSIATQNGHL